MTRTPRGSRTRPTRPLRAGLAGGSGAGADPARRLRPAPWPATAAARPARCPACSGPLALTGPTTPPACRWCGTAADPWSCAECGGHGLRAPVLGDARTAEELGRAFPQTRVWTSARDRILTDVDGHASIVVATPGAEPVAAGGYAAVVLLDTWLLLARADLRAGEEALRRWSNAVGLVRPGGTTLVVGDPAEPARAGAGALGPGRVRGARDRGAAGGPPAAGLAAGHDHAASREPSTTRSRCWTCRRAPRCSGRCRSDDEERVVVRVPRAHGGRLSAGARRAAAGPLGSQAGRRTDPGRPGRALTLTPRFVDWPAPSTPEEFPLAIQPIRLFGDPVLRKPRDRGRRLRQGAAHADLRPHRHHARRARRGPRRAADRRRAARLHLERRRRGRPPDQPGARPVRGDPGRPRGLPVPPGADLRLQARALGGRQGLQHVRRPGDDRGLRAARPGDPARDRPPRRGAVHRPARHRRRARRR